MSDSRKETRCSERRGGRAHRAGGAILLLLTALVSMTLLAGCSRAGITGDGLDSPEDASGDSASLARAEGLAFVRDGSLWVVTDGEERRVVESDGIRSLRNNRTGDAVTWVESDGVRTVVVTASTADWTPEPLWENDLGSLLSEAVHDDVTDTVWFSVSGEATTTIGAMDRLSRAAPRELVLPIDVAASIALDPTDGSLLLLSAAQEPADLLRTGSPPEVIVSAARIFAPRVSPDGRFVVATGALRPEDDTGLLLVDIGARSIRVLSAGRGVPSDPVWSRAGSTIAFRDSLTQSVWTVGAGGGDAQDSGLLADEGGLAW